MKKFFILVFALLFALSVPFTAMANPGGEPNNTGCNGVGNANSPCGGNDFPEPTPYECFGDSCSQSIAGALSISGAPAIGLNGGSATLPQGSGFAGGVSGGVGLSGSVAGAFVSEGTASIATSAGADGLAGHVSERYTPIMDAEKKIGVRSES